MLLQCDRFVDGGLGISLVDVVGESFGLIESPVTDGAVGIDANALLKRLGRLVVPEVVNEVETLIEPHLGFRLGARDPEMDVAGPSDTFGYRQVLRFDGG